MNSELRFQNNYNLLRLPAIPIYWLGSLGNRVVTSFKGTFGRTEIAEVTAREAQKALLSPTSSQPINPPASAQVVSTLTQAFSPPLDGSLRIEWEPSIECPTWVKDPNHPNWKDCSGELEMPRGKIYLPDQTQLILTQIYDSTSACMLSDPQDPGKLVRLRLYNDSSTAIGSAECLFAVNTQQFNLGISVDKKYQGQGVGEILFKSLHYLEQDLFQKTKEAIGSWRRNSDNFKTFKNKLDELAIKSFPHCATKEEFLSLPPDIQKSLLFAASATFTGKMYSRLFRFTPSYLCIFRNIYNTQEVRRIEVFFQNPTSSQSP